MWTSSNSKKLEGAGEKMMWVGSFNVFIFHFLSFFLWNKLPVSKRESEGKRGDEAVGVRGFSETCRPCR